MLTSKKSISLCSVGAHNGSFEGEKNIGFMFLVEVALGKMNNIKQSDGSQTVAPPGFDSIVARGSTEPGIEQIVFPLFTLFALFSLLFTDRDILLAELGTKYIYCS